MKVATLAAAVVLAAAVPVTAAATPDATVAVRTYNYANVTDGQLPAARAETERILRDAGISIAWRQCRVPGNVDGDACTESLEEGRTLMLRLVDRTPPGGTRVVALGESLVDTERRGGVLMTVDLFPVRVIADRAATRMATLLGRAIAHEIGHLLLGTSTHSKIGLMRAFWSHDEMRGARPAHWGFSSREAAQMRQSLRARSRTAN